MTRSIDADNLKAVLRQGCKTCLYNGRDYCRVSCEVNYFADLIDEMPTICDKSIDICKKSIALGYSVGKTAGRIEKAKETPPDADKEGGGANE